MRSALPVVISIVTLFADVVFSQGTCQGQSCYLASLSYSTGKDFVLEKGKKPTGGSTTGDICIVEQLNKLKVFKDSEKKKPPGFKRSENIDRKEAWEYLMSETTTDGSLGGDNGRGEASVVEPEVTLDKRATCSPYKVLFARGTTEFGALGSTVGPALASGLATDRNWSVQGVSSSDGYDASLNGIYCIGLPGGIACKDMINKEAKACPNTKFVTAGYSQGAMVARICAAFADEDVKKRIVGVLTFGDPFNGAHVKGIEDSKIKVICNPTDGVCKGDFSIGVGHLSYSTGPGVSWLKSLAK